MIVGYARTSTTGQAASLAAQERALKALGAERLYGEQVSSTGQRSRLAECLAYLRDGDVPAVTKPDRLARSTAELLAIEADLSRRGIGLVILSMGGERMDTRNPTSKLMLAILAGVATWGREIMIEWFQAFLHDLKAEAWPPTRDVPAWRGDARGFRAQAGRRYRPSMRQKLDVPGIYADALSAMPDSMDGQPPLPVPAVCPVTLDELVGAEG